MEFSDGKTLRQALRKLWPAVMTAEGAVDEEGLVGFNVHNRDIVNENVLMFKKLDPSSSSSSFCRAPVANAPGCTAAIGLLYYP
jgi:hypothetical protein